MCDHSNIFSIDRHIGNIGNGYEINGLIRRMITFESVFLGQMGVEKEIISSTSTGYV